VQYCSGFSFIQGIKNLRIVIDKWGKNHDLGEEKTKQNKMLWNSRGGERGKKTAWWSCHGDQTPTSVAYNGRGSRQASEDN
jgi:hypothetical protein